MRNYLVWIAAATLAACSEPNHASRVMEAEPEVVHALLDQALTLGEGSSTVTADTGKEIVMDARVERLWDKTLILHTSANGVPVYAATYKLEPQDGGKRTLVTVDVTADHDARHEARGDGGAARSDFLADRAMGRRLQQSLDKIATIIERRKRSSSITATKPAESSPPLPGSFAVSTPAHVPEPSASMSSQPRRDAEFRMGEPMIDPRADARRQNRSQEDIDRDRARQM